MRALATTGAVCGKMNHIQWLVLRPSTSTDSKSGRPAVRPVMATRTAPDMALSKTLQLPDVGDAQHGRWNRALRTRTRNALMLLVTDAGRPSPRESPAAEPDADGSRSRSHSSIRLESTWN